MMAPSDWSFTAKRPRGYSEPPFDPVFVADPASGVFDAVRTAYRELPAELPDDIKALLRRLN